MFVEIRNRLPHDIFVALVTDPAPDGKFPSLEIARGTLYVYVSADLVQTTRACDGIPGDGRALIALSAIAPGGSFIEGGVPLYARCRPMFDDALGDVPHDSVQDLDEIEKQRLTMTIGALMEDAPEGAEAETDPRLLN